MSAFLLGRGFRADMGTCIRKLVLLKLIDACEDDGSRIFPAMETVARAAQCSKRQVQREIRAMIEVGLLHLVREGGSGRRSTNEYRMDLTVLDRIATEGWAAVAGSAPAACEVKGDTVSPLDDGPKGDTGDTDRVTPATPKGDNGSHTTPPDSSTDSCSERARASEEIQKSESEDGDIEDPKRIEARGWALLKDWPGFAGMPKDAAMRAWKALSAEERAEAEHKFKPWLALLKAQRKSHVPAPSTYFGQKLFSEVPEASAAPAPPRFEPAYGPAFAVAVWRDLVSGPKAEPPPLKAWEANCVALGQINGEKLDLDRQAKHGWPEVNRLFAVVGRGGTAIPEGSLDHLKHLVEPVPVGSAIWHAWKQEHEKRGWPWAEGFGFGRVVYFPKGGPDGLEAFALAVAQAGQNGDKADEHAGQSQAAE